MGAGLADKRAFDMSKTAPMKIIAALIIGLASASTLGEPNSVVGKYEGIGTSTSLEGFETRRAMYFAACAALFDQFAMVAEAQGKISEATNLRNYGNSFLMTALVTYAGTDMLTLEGAERSKAWSKKADLVQGWREMIGHEYGMIMEIDFAQWEATINGDMAKCATEENGEVVNSATDMLRSLM
jgi:hypothetical protein